MAAARENRIAVVVGLMLLALLALAGAPLGEARTVMDEGGEYSIPSSPPIPRDPEGARQVSG